MYTVYSTECTLSSSAILLVLCTVTRFNPVNMIILYFDCYSHTLILYFHFCIPLYGMFYLVCSLGLLTLVSQNQQCTSNLFLWHRLFFKGVSVKQDFYDAQ